MIFDNYIYDTYDTNDNTNDNTNDDIYDIS